MAGCRNNYGKCISQLLILHQVFVLVDIRNMCVSVGVGGGFEIRGFGITIQPMFVGVNDPDEGDSAIPYGRLQAGGDDYNDDVMMVNT